MLLKEDGHLDIEKVKQLNEEQLNEEMEDWGEDQWYEWDHKDGTMTHKEVYEYLTRKINEVFDKREGKRRKEKQITTIKVTIMIDTNLTYEEFMKLSKNPPQWEGDTLFKLTIVTIDKHQRRRYPKYDVCEYSQGFFHTREEAEQIMRQNTTGKDECGNRIYCYYLYEEPYTTILNICDFVSCRVYDAYGQLIEHTLCSQLNYDDTTYNRFWGRPAEKFRFKEGDIVEVMGREKVFLAVIIGCPTTPKDIWTCQINMKQRLLENHIENGGTKNNFNYDPQRDSIFYDIHDDAYTIIDGPSARCHHHTIATDIFAPHFPIPDKIRQRFENYYKKFLKERERYDGKQ